MRTTLIPQNLPSYTAPISIRSTKDNLAKAQIELSSGRWSDVGYKLAGQTGMALDVRGQIGLAEVFENTNSIVKTRVEVTQNAISNMVQEAQSFFDSVVAARSSQTSSSVIEQSARQSLVSFVSSVNTTINGVYVFSGINSNTAPLKDYFVSPLPSSKSAVDNAFFTEFGISQSDPAVANITPAAMENFIDNAFGDLFDEVNWKSDWSSATDEKLKTRISFSQDAETSQTANESAIRKLAMSYTLVADLGITEQNKAVFETVMKKAAEFTSEAIGELNELGAKIGVTQQKIEVANEKLSVQKNVFEKLLGERENTDPYEVATRIKLLTNQLEASYAVTARLQQLSLTKYL